MSYYTKPKYVNVPLAYDIETTSYRDEGEKAAVVYTHTFSDDGEVTIDRDWESALETLDSLIEKYDVTPSNRLVIYVHNLAYEFGFIRRYLDWAEVKAIGANHRIVRAATTSGIEFRCSYLLTNAGLAHVGGEVGVEKMLGDLDYDLMRHSATELTEEEIGYIVNDVQIIIELIRQKIAKDGGIDKIPMTSTGYVRRSVRAAVRKDPDYMKQIQKMPLTVDDYVMSRSSFSGGYVHSNANTTGKVTKGVTMVDLASSYPASLIKGEFPMGVFTEFDNPTLKDVLSMYGKASMLMDVTIRNIKSNYPFPPISISKTTTAEGVTVDNGRIYAASGRVRLTITEVDLQVILRAYDIEAISINRLKVAPASRLPRALGDAILSYYSDKTTLKGIPEKEEHYKLAKGNSNSIYGMVATDPVRDEFEFDMTEAEMVSKPVSVIEAVDAHNNSKNRFLYYPWSSWVTAYSRSILLNTIYDLIDAGVLVLYCDTDSIAFKATGELLKKAWEIIKLANAKVIAKLKGYFNNGETEQEIIETIAPKTVKGERKPLGVFEEDGEYDSFKSLGAKRYATTQTVDGVECLSITVSGLSKNANKYIEENGGMDFFKDGMTIPAEHSGRLVHTYSDNFVSNKLIDYNGVTEEVSQWGFVHLEAVDYKLSLSDDYTTFMQQIKGEGASL